MSFGISVNDLPEQSTTVPSHEQLDGHGPSEKQSLGFFMSSKPVNENNYVFIILQYSYGKIFIH